MSIHIVIHALPQEIDQLENLLILLKRNSVYLPKDHNIFVDVTLNANLIKWNYLPVGYFKNRFKNLETLTWSWAHCYFRFDEIGIMNGCNDVRRYAIRNTQSSYVMYLDADNIFNDYFLLYMYTATERYLEKGIYRIIVPEITRMWDTTWDPITNSSYMQEDASHEVYDNRDPYSILTVDGQVSLREVNQFKFAGWGTTIDTKLARLIDIPDSLGSYGLDDTFIMHGCEILRQKGYKVKQYVLENQVIIENNKFRYNPYKEYLCTLYRKQEFLAQAQANFQPELQKLYNRL